MSSSAMKILLTMLIGLGFCSSHAGAATMTIGLPNGLHIRKHVVSLREARYKNVVRQKYDLSCGAAALATILRYFFNEDIDETDIIKSMLEHGDKEKISKKGFSLLDLKNFAQHKDYVAAGYKEIPVEKLRNLKIPAIILLESGRYSHFVVLKGIRSNKVFISDPAFGNRSMSITNFGKSWDGIIFVVVSRTGRPTSKLVLDTTLPAPEMNVARIQQLGPEGFSFFQTPGEF